MEPLIIYLLKANVIISILFLFYLFVLKNDKSFWQNRFYLLSSLLLALLLPLLPAISFSHLDTIQRQITTANPLNDLYTTIGSSQVVNTHVSTPINTNINNVPIAIKQGFVFPSLMQTLVGIYLLVSLVLLIILAVKLLKISILIKKTDKQLTAGIYYCAFDGTAPFSFFNYLVINKQLFNDRELQQIISHEKVHIRQWHSVDILAAELVHAILWVNPLMVYLKRCIKLNHEYIADAEVINSGVDKKDYQLSILHNSLKLPAYQLTNLYNSSKIKTRIKMMNLKKSSNANLYKYAFVLLLVATSYFLINPSSAVALNKKVSLKNTRADARANIKITPANAEKAPIEFTEDKGPVSGATSQKNPGEKSNTADAGALKAFEGLYQAQGNKSAYIKVTEVNNVLLGKQLWDGREYSFKQKSELEFISADAQPISVKFTKDNNGNVTQAVVNDGDVWLKVNDDNLKEPALNTQQLKALEGIYQNDANKAIYVQVIAKQNKLITKRLWDGKEVSMSPQSDVSFFVEDPHFKIVNFTKNDQGIATKFRAADQEDWNKVDSYHPTDQIKLPPKTLKKLEGYYESKERKGQFVQFTATEGGLVLKQLWDNRLVDLTAESPLAFSAKDNPWLTLQFSADNAGSVTQVLAWGKDVWERNDNYKPPVELKLTAQELKKFEGKYEFRNTKGSFLQISANDGGLVVKQLWDGKEFEIAARGPLAFSVKNDLSFTLQFTADNADGITQVLVFGKDIWDKVDNDQASAEIKLTAQDLKKFEGKYEFRNKKGTFLQVTATDSGLIVTESWDGKQYDFTATSPFVFSAKKVAGFTLQFISDGAGNITQLLGGKDYWDKVK